MLTFEKIKSDFVSNNNFFYFLIDHIKVREDLSLYDDVFILENLISSVFHYWFGEAEPEGQGIFGKCCGFFDNNKITANDYAKVTLRELHKKLFDLIDKESEGQNISIVLDKGTILPSSMIKEMIDDVKDGRDINKEKYIADMVKNGGRVTACDPEGFRFKVANLVSEDVTDSMVVYHLNLDEEINLDKVAEHTMYSVFTRFLVIDRKKNKILLIDLGDD